MKFVFNDGGRAEAGYKGKTGDCVVRAIAIATKKPYREVYNEINALCRKYNVNGRSSARKGVPKEVYKAYLESNGWEWVSTMGIGTGCTVKLNSASIPEKNIIARLSKHLVAIVDGNINDTYDCSRNGNRCIYGYFRKK
jgi:hypothetical protein